MGDAKRASLQREQRPVRLNRAGQMDRLRLTLAMID
jgi:hypothetical protein